MTVGLGNPKSVGGVWAGSDSKSEYNGIACNANSLYCRNAYRTYLKNASATPPHYHPPQELKPEP